MRRSLGLVAALCAAWLLCPGPAAAGARVPDGFYGVVTQGDLGRLDDDFSMMGKAGVGHLRFLVYWPQVQRDRGPCEPVGPALLETNACDWSRVDSVVAGAAAAGIHVLPFVYGSPSWLDGHEGVPSDQSDRVPPIYTAADRAAWKDFLDAAVSRYGPGGAFWMENPAVAENGEPLDAVQIWNEPSSATYFQPKPSANRYAKLLEISSEAVDGSSAGSQVKVILAGLFGTPLGGRGGIDMPEFLEQLYRVDGVRKHFAAAAVHPYSPGLGGLKLQVKLARKEMRQGGDTRAQLWVTELGWASKGPESSDLAKSPRGQARLLRRAFELLRKRRERWNIGRVSWFSWRDVPGEESSCAACPWTGLLKKNGVKKPAYDEFREFAAGP